MFENKKILFFCPKTFGYEAEIASMLESLGFDVTYFNDRPNNNNFTKALIRLFPRFMWFFSDFHYLNILKNIEGSKFDYIFVIRGEGLSPRFIRKLKESYPDSKLILHLWDNVKNIKNVDKKFHLFDSVSSYDPVDCSTYKLKFRPLFYLDKYKLNLECNNFNKNIFFIGTFHSDRADVILSLMDKLPEFVTLDYYIFFRSKLEYYILCLLNKNVRNLDTHRVSFTPYPFEFINERLSKSSFVLDVEHPNNNGLTIRTFEMLASGKRILTTNNLVPNYDFYNEDIFHCFNRKSIDINSDFFNDINTQPSVDFYTNYSLKSWLIDILV